MAIELISGEEFARRMQRVSQLRNVILSLWRAALDAWERGEIPFRPRIDIRSDVEYWKNLAAEKGIE